MIEVRDLHFQYKKAAKPALQGLSFHVDDGKLVALLGPNGSGKSTTFKVISTQVTNWKGSVSIAGLDVQKNISQVRAKLGICFQNASLDKILTAYENLHLHGRVLGLSADTIKKEITEIAAKLNVDYLDKRVSDLSGGQARRIEIAKALLGSGKLLLLDEPSTGLDPQARKDLWDVLTSLRKRGVTVLVTTHLIEEAELCDELIFLSEGRCVDQGRAAELKAKLGYELLIVEIENLGSHKNDLEKILQPNEKLFVRDQSLVVKSSDVSRLFEWARANWGSKLKRLEWSKPSLSDLYFDLTGRTYS